MKIGHFSEPFSPQKKLDNAKNKIPHADKHVKMKKIISQIFDLVNFVTEIFKLHIKRFSKIMAPLKFQCSP